MFTVRKFFVCVVIFVTFIGSVWYGFRRTNAPGQSFEDGVDMYAPFYQDPAVSTPIGGMTSEKFYAIPSGKGEGEEGEVKEEKGKEKPDAEKKETEEKK